MTRGEMRLPHGLTALIDVRELPFVERRHAGEVFRAEVWLFGDDAPLRGEAAVFVAATFREALACASTWLDSHPYLKPRQAAPVAFEVDNYATAGRAR